MNNMISISDVFATAANEPIIRSLLDTDMYKFTMGQFINQQEDWAQAETKFSLIVRSEEVNLADVIPERSLRAQLDAAQELRFQPAELSYLRGLPLGDDRLFSDKYIEFLRGYQLPNYKLAYHDDGIELSFSGPWKEVTYWETIALPIISELYYYWLVRNHDITDAEFTAMYSRLLSRTLSAVEKLRLYDLTFADFGTRRRHSFRHQKRVLNIMAENLPDQYAGTSNVLLAKQAGSSNPIGTNAHELPMVVANLTANDRPEEIRESQYEVVRRWHEMYPQLSILLPDTFGTTQFLDNAPDWMAQECQGVRLDSKDLDIATDEVIEWWESHGVDLQEKMLIPSDGLTPKQANVLYREHGHKVGTYTFGIGTNLTNNSAGVWPRVNDPGYEPFSVVIKVTEANGKPAVKLSDNPAKAQGGERAEWFKEIFGAEGRSKRELVV
jgi:nicotinate phosphoribosyltransferase